MKRLTFVLAVVIVLSACKEKQSFEEQLVGEWEVKEQLFRQLDSGAVELVQARQMEVVFNADQSGMVLNDTTMVWTYLSEHNLVVIDRPFSFPSDGYTFSVVIDGEDDQLWEQVEILDGFGFTQVFTQSLQWQLSRVK